jgi:hypothetical protein
MEWHHATSAKKKVRTVSLACKVTELVFWDVEGYTLVEFLEKEGTVSMACYIQMLKNLHCALCENTQ